MKWLSLVCLLWMAAPAYADSEEVDERVWSRMISNCHNVRHDNMWPHTHMLEDTLEYEYPLPVRRLGARIERCQDSVRRRIIASARQCRAGWYVQREWEWKDHHRRALNVLDADCPGQYATLLDEYERCCAVIPGY